MFKERVIFKTIRNYLESPEAIIITGMRRTGKTTLLRYIYDRIGTDNRIFLDLENPLNRRYFEEENYDRIKTAFEILGLDFSKRPCIFIDEIQAKKGAEGVYLRHRTC